MHRALLNTIAAEHDDVWRAQIRDARRLFGTKPAAGKLTVLVTHGVVVQETTGQTLEEGEAIVFRPLGNSRFRVVGRVMPREWGTLRRPASTAAAGLRVQEYPVPPGTHPHDVAPAPDGTVWYTAQHTGKLGGSTRRRARRRRSRSATARRRTASSSGPTAPRGSPTAG